MWSRRQVLGAGVLAVAARPVRAFAKDASMTSELILRTIPSTGEQLPAIGLGSWQTFDVADPATVQPVIARFLALGGRAIDSSPMYGRSEEVIGTALAAIPGAQPWLATKVWTRGKAAGIAQMKRSLERLRVTTLDLMQIHNLVDWKVQLSTLRSWKAAGTIRYLGVTHYSHAAFSELEQLVRTERLDFVQLPYSAAERDAEKRLLPAAADAGVAVLVMQPFASGALFTRVKGKPLPAVAAELECTSWAQLLLKFILAHPAVTCPIPATSSVEHLEDNLGALRGPVPTRAQRDAIIAAL
jgi:aryl-alcohol dehydrogenase-like predicted oxidoreductase